MKHIRDTILNTIPKTIYLSIDNAKEELERYPFEQDFHPGMQPLSQGEIEANLKAWNLEKLSLKLHSCYISLLIKYNTSELKN